MSKSTKWRHDLQVAHRLLNESSEDSDSNNSILSVSENQNVINQSSLKDDNLSNSSSETCDNDTYEGQDKFPIFESEHSDFDFLSDEPDNESNDEMNLKEEIAAWAVLFLIKNDALSALLCILKRYGLSVPKDARTLSKTQKT